MRRPSADRPLRPMELFARDAPLWHVVMLWFFCLLGVRALTDGVIEAWRTGAVRNLLVAVIVSVTTALALAVLMRLQASRARGEGRTAASSGPSRRR